MKQTQASYKRGENRHIPLSSTVSSHFFANQKREKYDVYLLLGDRVIYGAASLSALDFQNQYNMHTLNKDDGALTTFNHEAQSYCTRKCCICCILILLVVTMQLEYYNYQYNRHIATPITQVTQIVQDSSWLDKDVNLTSLMIPPTMPALVILGPAKTGTSSLALNLNQYVDIVWYGSEHPYWTTRACLNQDLTHDQWKTFINDFIDPNKNIKLSSIASNFVAGFANDTTKTDCSVNFFYTNWLTLKAAKDASNRRCIHPQIFLGRDAANIKVHYIFSFDSNII